LTVIYVDPTDMDRRAQSVEQDRQLRANLQLADELGAEIVRLRGDVSTEIADYAKNHGIAHLIMGHPTHGRWHEFFRGSVTSKVLRRLSGVDVHIIAS